MHLSEFKAKVRLETLRGVKSTREIGKEFDVHPVQLMQLMQLSQWNKEIQEQVKILFEGQRGSAPVSAHKEPERRYCEISTLRNVA